MKKNSCSLDGVLILNPQIHSDSRGHFMELFKIEQLLDFKVQQINQAVSKKKCIRGLHFQKPPFDQAKLVRCISGKVLDVAVDLRNGSKTYGQHLALELSSENKRQLFVPRGFAHGFLVLSENAIFSYKVDNVYAPDYDSGIRWNDPLLNIRWGMNKSEILVSNKV